jgi:hypothetical protein
VIVVLLPEGISIGGGCDKARRAKLSLISSMDALMSDKREQNSDVTLVDV